MGPSMEYFRCLRTRTALQLSFDGPRKRRLGVLGKDGVGAKCIEIFCVEKETVHVE